MPKASVSSTVAVKPGALRNCRNANCTSCITVVILTLPRASHGHSRGKTPQGNDASRAPKPRGSLSRDLSHLQRGLKTPLSICKRRCPELDTTNFGGGRQSVVDAPSHGAPMSAIGYFTDC